jgi:uroporphyrinogen-III synthase
MNAVEAVTKMTTEIAPPWDVYCLGNTTKELVKKKLQCNILADAADATSLANKIITDAPVEVWFFCGNRRRDELPEILLTNGIKVQEVIVYKTTAVHHIINSQFDGVLFYSPSAVESFFSVNKVGSSTVLFAIGKQQLLKLESFQKTKSLYRIIREKNNCFIKCLTTFDSKQ